MFDLMNKLGSAGVPFIFLINFDKTQGRVCPLTDAADNGIFFDFPGSSNSERLQAKARKKINYSFRAPSFDSYGKAFNYVVEQERQGNSYLVNLTFPSDFYCDCGLAEIFKTAKSLFKAYCENRFTFFSPERFIRIINGRISTCPMKGTIKDSGPGSRERLLGDSKEYAEHVTVVDLLRNDLNLVSKNVRVDNFRYIDRVGPAADPILQVSSKITGDLPGGWQSRIGSIFENLLPAGSICGAPKKMTCEIIAEAENYDRGFYTGVMGVFDGRSLDSAVIIRYIEKSADGLIYKSGGGITIYSDCRKEYEELMDKIYVPVC